MKVFGLTTCNPASIISKFDLRSLSVLRVLLNKAAFVALGSALLVLFALPVHAQITYTSDPNIGDFTSTISTYAQFSNFSCSGDSSCAPTLPFTPSASELATYGYRVYNGTLTATGTGEGGNGLSNGNGDNWLQATFPNAVSTIVVFPNIDHYGSSYDGYQYKIAGSNDGLHWTLLFDATAVSGTQEPFTLGKWTGTPPTSVNNVLTPQTASFAGCSGTSTPCSVGYIATFTFSTAYQYYALGPSTQAINSGNSDQELSAVGTPNTVVQTFNPNGATVSDFSNSSGTNTQTIDTSTAGGNLTCNQPSDSTTNCPAITLITSNNAVDATATWPQYVNGTPWATSVCAARPANGGNGNLCSLFVNACYGGNVSQSQADDFYCPYVTPGQTGAITLLDTWDPLLSKPTIAQGTTVSLIDFVPSAPGQTWTPSPAGQTTPPNSACTNVSTAFQCELSDTLNLMYGDQTTTRGSKPKKGWIVTVFGVPMLTTQWSIVTGLPGNPMCPTPTTPLNNNPMSPTDWFNASCQIQYVVTEAATPPAPNNGFVAAPPASITYGQFPAIVPASTDVSTTNTGLGNPWTSNPVSLTTFLESIGGSGGDGTYILHWSAVDNVGISEKNIQLQTTNPTCPNPVPNGSPSTFPEPCYNTNLFTTTINVDSTKPTIATAGFTPAGSPAGTFGVGELAYPKYMCSDNLSGLSNCGGIPVSCPLVVGPETLTSPTALDTSKAGPHSFNVTATDCAGNVSNTATVNYNVLPPADVAIYELETTDHPKHGTNFTYVAWALDLSLQNAYNVNFSIQFTLPVGVLAPGGAVTGIVADCALFGGCSAPPTTGKNCTVTSLNTLYTVTCNVGTLQTLWSLHGSVAAVTIPLATTAAGKQFTITATVNSSGDPNLKNNTTMDTITPK